MTANDAVITSFATASSSRAQDTATSPEALVYDPIDRGTGTYHVRVCDFADGAAGSPRRPTPARSSSTR